MLPVFRWKPIISVHSAKEQQQKNSFLACTMYELINQVDSYTVNSQVKQSLRFFHMYGLYVLSENGTINFLGDDEVPK